MMAASSSSGPRASIWGSSSRTHEGHGDEGGRQDDPGVAKMI